MQWNLGQTVPARAGDPTADTHNLNCGYIPGFYRSKGGEGLHPKLDEENGTWKAEDFPQLRELRIVVDCVECMEDREGWKKAWERLPETTAIDLRPERLEVVLQRDKTDPGVCCCYKEHRVVPPDCAGYVRDILVGITCGHYLWAWCERGRRDVASTALRY
jgi:hypothetical protein